MSREGTAELELTQPIRETRDRRAEQRRRRRRRRVAAGVLAVAAAGAGALALGSVGDGMPPGVAIGGVDVGGISLDEARTRVQARAREILRGRVAFRAAHAPSFSRTVDASALASGARIDEALAQAHRARGLVSRALARVGVGGRKEIPLRFSPRAATVTALLRDVDGELGRAAVSATVRVEGEDIVTTPARTGRAVDRAALTASLSTLPPSVEVRLREAAAPVDDAEAAQAQALARRVVARPRDVTLEGRSAVLTPAAARRALRFPVAKGTVRVRLHPDTLRAALVAPLGVNEQPPVDARLEIRGDRVAVIPSRAGRLLNGAALGAAIVADPEAPTVAARIQARPADFTTAEARALRIRERVSSFTTNYDCCPPRVANIRRAAETLDGRIIPAGGRFSLNDALGERTAARGYVSAPTIAAGELVDSIGGGVSQVATTMYNAAFFAGLDIEAHTPHEFYISRYPMGREATISWRQPDLVFRNDWDAAILIAAGAGSNGITISFYSSRLGRRVETATGEPTDRTVPKTIEKQNPDLPAGTRKVIQSSGANGFSVSYTRKVYAGDELKRDERYRWRYRPQNAIVELGPPLPQEPAEPKDPKDPAPPDGSAPPPDATTPPAAPGGEPAPPTP